MIPTICVIIGALMALIPNLYEYYNKHTHKPIKNGKFKKIINKAPVTSAILGALMTIIAGIYEYNKKVSDDRIQSNTKLADERKRNVEYKNIIKSASINIAKSIDIMRTQKEVLEQATISIDKSKQIIKTQQTVIGLQKQIDTKNKKIQDLQNTTLRNITGGKSFPKLEFWSYSGVTVCKIVNDTDFPLRNVSITISQFIEDSLKGDQSGRMTLKDPNAYKEFSYTFGDILPHYRHTFFMQTYNPPVKKIDFIYNVRWLNGYYRGGINRNFLSPTLETSNLYYLNIFNYKNAVKVSEVVTKEIKEQKPSNSNSEAFDHP
jgi:hypothetical protein